MRLTFLAHAPTLRTRDSVFGDVSDLAPGSNVEQWPRSVDCITGPEVASRRTADLLGFDRPETIDAVAGPDFGHWTGRTLEDVGAADSEQLMRWLSDPSAAPHGGESLAQVMIRVGEALDSRDWAAAGALVVVTPLVARAAAAYALGCGPAAMLRIDVPPSGRVVLSKSGPHWRLTQLQPK